MFSLAAIILDNALFKGAHWGKPGEPDGPRMSESFDAACGFVAYNMYFGEGGVLVLDRNLLEKDYPIKSYVDRVSGEDMVAEKEIVALTPLISNLDRYLVSISADPDFIRGMASREMMELAFYEGGWPASFSDSEEDMKRMANAMEALLVHEKLNVISSFVPPHLDNLSKERLTDVGFAARSTAI